MHLGVIAAVIICAWRLCFPIRHGGSGDLRCHIHTLKWLWSDTRERGAARTSLFLSDAPPSLCQMQMREDGMIIFRKAKWNAPPLLLISKKVTACDHRDYYSAKRALDCGCTSIFVLYVYYVFVQFMAEREIYIGMLVWAAKAGKETFVMKRMRNRRLFLHWCLT